MAVKRAGGRLFQDYGLWAAADGLGADLCSILCNGNGNGCPGGWKKTYGSSEGVFRSKYLHGNSICRF